MVFLPLTLAKEVVAWPLSGKQSRNFRGEELSTKKPEAIIFGREMKGASVPVLFLVACTELLASV